MLRKLRQRLGRKMRPDGVILKLRAELVPDLFVDSVNDLLARKHDQTLPLITRMQNDLLAMPASAKAGRQLFCS